MSWRLVQRWRKEFGELRRSRLEEIAAAEAEFMRICQEERALLEWARHHLDELLRRRGQVSTLPKLGRRRKTLFAESAKRSGEG